MQKYGSAETKMLLAHEDRGSSILLFHYHRVLSNARSLSSHLYFYDFCTEIDQMIEKDVKRKVKRQRYIWLKRKMLKGPPWDEMPLTTNHPEGAFWLLLQSKGHSR